MITDKAQENENSETNNKNVLLYLKELEECAEDVLADRQEVVDLDRKRHFNREALSALDKHSKKPGGSKSWIALGNTFLKLPTKHAQDILRKGKLKKYQLKPILSLNFIHFRPKTT